MSKQLFSKRLRMEQLEPKLALAGDVLAAVVGGDLFLTGDNGGNNIELTNGAMAGEYVLTAAGDFLTTINGMASATVTGVIGDVIVSLGDSGIINFLRADLPSNLNVTMANGSEGLLFGVAPDNTFGSTVAGDVIVESGDFGTDGIVVGASTIEGDFIVNTHAVDTPFAITFRTVQATIEGNFQLNAVQAEGIVIVSAEESFYGSDFVVQSGDNGAGVLITGTEITSDVRLEFGEGDDSVTFFDGEQVVGNDVFIDFGGGENVLEVEATSIGQDLLLETGDGETTVEAAEVSIARDLRATLNGENSFESEELLIGRDLRVQGGDGSELFVLEVLEIGRDLRLDLDDGDNSFEAEEVIVGRDFAIETGAGEDVVFVDTLDVGDDVAVQTGNGADEVDFDDLIIADDFTVSTSGGDDSFRITDSIVGGSTTVILGNGLNDALFRQLDAGVSLAVQGQGTNEIELEGVMAISLVAVVTAGGNDTISFEGVETGLGLITTSAGEDSVALVDSAFEQLIVLLGSGNDLLELGSVEVDLFALLSGGSGNDTYVELDANNMINNEWDFGFENYEEDF